MYLIVGLGNPGLLYRNTRHNVGFMAVERFVEEEGGSWRMDRAHKARIAKFGDTMVIEPQTYMNNSGVAVAAVQKMWKIPLDNILVVMDDVLLEIGTLRSRRSGSHGGHRGLESVIAHLGTDNIARLRIGAGIAPEGAALERWVLGRIPRADRSVLQTSLAHANKNIRAFINGSWKEETITV